MIMTPSIVSEKQRCG